MSRVEKIDLREKPRGCKEHPLIRLKKVIEKLDKNTFIEVITDEEIIPLSTLEVLVRRKGLKLEIIEDCKDYVKVVISK